MRADPYAPVDTAIAAWASDNRLHVYPEHKGYVVRSVDIARPRRWFRQRPAFQIWVDVPNADGCVGVHAWDRSQLRSDWQPRVEDVRGALDAALHWVHTHA